MKRSKARDRIVFADKTPDQIAEFLIADLLGYQGGNEYRSTDVARLALAIEVLLEQSQVEISPQKAYELFTGRKWSVDGAHENS